MTQIEIQRLISLGFTPANYFKRSAWMNIQRVMEFLSNKGFVVRTKGEIKYSTLNGNIPTIEELEYWAKAYLASPLTSHIEEMKKLSKELGLPLNSGKLLKAYMDFKIA